MTLQLWGLCFGAAGSVVVLYGIVVKGLGEIIDESAPYWRSNPFVVKAALNAQTQAIAGALLLVTGFLLYLIAVYERDLQLPALPAEAGIWEHLVVTVLASALVAVIAMGSAQFIARSRVFKALLPRRAEGLEWASYVLLHGGQAPERTKCYEAPLALNISKATRFLAVTERLLDLSGAEDVEERIRKIRRLFDKHGVTGTSKN